MTKLLVIAAVLVPALASAEPGEGVQQQADFGAKSRLTGGLGLFTPTGSLNLEYAYVPHPNFEVALGAGLGFSGPQLAVMPRLRAGAGRMSFSVGGGVSSGQLTIPELFCFDEDCTDTKTTAVWANVEVGVQATTETGFVFRAYGGVGRVIAHGECTGDECMTVQGMELPYGGLSIGHTL